MLRFGVLFLIAFVPRFCVADTFELTGEDVQKRNEIAALKNEISNLELELDKCKRANKNWRTATWVGAAG